MSRSLALLSVSVLVACVACGAPQPGDESSVGENESAVVTTLASKTIKTLGTLTYGATSGEHSFYAAPEYRAYKFSGKKGDMVDAWVHSTDGDAMGWLLDSKYTVLTQNDNSATGVTDSHLTHTLTGAGTYYIAYREKSGKKATYDVSLSLDGTNINYFACKADSDCVAVAVAECCGSGRKEAVNVKEQSAYESSVICAEHKICPLFIVYDDRVAECDLGTKKCEMVQPTEIACGGFADLHNCPANYTCQVKSQTPDALGTCVANP